MDKKYIISSGLKPTRFIYDSVKCVDLALRHTKKIIIKTQSKKRIDVDIENELDKALDASIKIFGR